MNECIIVGYGFIHFVALQHAATSAGAAHLKAVRVARLMPDQYGQGSLGCRVRAQPPAIRSAPPVLPSRYPVAILADRRPKMGVYSLLLVDLRPVLIL